MLSLFSVANYKSIRDEAILDMQASSSAEHQESLIMGASGEKHVPVAVIYGPNGGGKPNTLEAISTLRSFVLHNIVVGSFKRWQSLKFRQVVPFAFSEKKRKEPTTFDAYFDSEHIAFHYHIAILNNVIQNESFGYLESNDPKTLFSRDGDTIDLYGEMSDSTPPEGFSREMPYLSYLFMVKRENPIVKAALKWFVEGVEIFDFSVDITERLMGMTDHEELKPQILNLMKKMDLEIEDYKIEHEGEKVQRITFIHSVGGNLTPLDFYDESAGTRKVFSMLMRLLLCLKRGSLLVLDELDAKLHPMLLRFIISLFTNKKVNIGGAQLIFTSHDVVNLNNKVFRDDEIWFAAKDKNKGTKLYSLADFNQLDGVRNALAEAYMDGKFGADPYLEIMSNW